jgi:hypothetical protein
MMIPIGGLAPPHEPMTWVVGMMFTT